MSLGYIERSRASSPFELVRSDILYLKVIKSNKKCVSKSVEAKEGTGTENYSGTSDLQ